VKVAQDNPTRRRPGRRISASSRSRASARRSIVDLEQHARGGTSGFLAICGLIALAPCFFVYHAGLGAGWYGDFAAGLWAPSIALFGVVSTLALPSLWRVHSGRASVSLTLFVVLMLYVLLWSLTHRFVNAGPLQVIAFGQVLATWIAWLALFFVGAWLPWRRLLLRRALWFSLSGMALVMLPSLDFSRVLFVVGDGGLSSGVAGYQQLARSATIVGLMLVALSQSRLAALVAGCATLAMLFVIGARTEFFGFALVLMFYAAVRLRRDSLAGRSVMIVGVSAALLAAIMVFDTSRLMSSRQLEVLSLSEASSWIARSQLLQAALEQITQSPLIGDFVGHLRGGNTGGYAHNALSAWVLLGFFGFTLYLVSIVWTAITATSSSLRSQTNRPIWDSAMVVALFSLLSAIAAKPVFWPLPALAWGLAVNGILSDRFVSLRRRRRTSNPQQSR